MKDYFRRIIWIFASSPQNEETTQVFYRWLSDEEHAEKKDAALKDLWKKTDAEMAEPRVSAALSDVYRKVGVVRSIAGNMKPARRFSLAVRFAAAAAVLVGIVFLTRYVTKEEYGGGILSENYTHAGERRSLELPDGSRVQINSTTVLIYPQKFAGETRTVFLVGEADFDVAKDADRPFIVRAGAMKITALGTKFNVSAYSECNEVTATLLEGKVKVECGEENGDVYILAQGEAVSYQKNTGESELYEADIEAATAWQHGVLLFRSKTLEEIAGVLQRKYGVRFFFEPGFANDDKYNFRFPEDASIGTVLEIMEAVTPEVNYELNGTVCHVK